MVYLAGLNIDDSINQVNFSIPMITIILISGGLTWFMALTWSNYLQNIYDEYKRKELEKKGDSGDSLLFNFILALISTILVVIMMYILLKLYIKIKDKLMIQIK